jgi:Circadian oscillating protein COP23
MKKTINSIYVITGMATIALQMLLCTQIAVAKANQKVSFICGKDSSQTPTTYAVVEGSSPVPMIAWKSEYFAPSGYTPLTRCKDVSQRLTDFTNNHSSLIITHGIVNKQKAICLTDKMGGSCKSLLYTLKPSQDANKTLKNLLRLNPLDTNSDPVIEGKRPVLSVDMTNVLSGGRPSARYRYK